MDVIFGAHTIQEICREQKQGLYMVFTDSIKAFDSISREAL